MTSVHDIRPPRWVYSRSMIRLRIIEGAEAPLARDRIVQAQDIHRRNFPGWEHDADRIFQWLRDPVQSGWRAVLIVAETGQGRVNGFALVLHFPRLNMSFLDYLAVRQDIRGGGLGSALYEAVREYCLDVGSRGLLLETEPDDPDLVDDPDTLAENCRRLRFYEHYGVRPIVGTDYHLPLGEPPTHAWLLFDGLGKRSALPRDEARRAVRTILTTRFGDLTEPAYIRRVVRSIRDDPVTIRPPRYIRRRTPAPPKPGRLDTRYALVVNHQHVIHHVRERGYEERPARVGALLKAVNATGLFTSVRPRRFPESHIHAVHDKRFVGFLKRLCNQLPSGRPTYADTFPHRRPGRRPRRIHPDLLGYYCMDAFTPLDAGAYRAARAAVDVALTAADELLAGMPLAYAMCRPPGHHATVEGFGGFCYFNNAAVAAQKLADHGTVAVLDIDFHHGNGTQDIFYRRSDVLTLSLHGDPADAYPYFTGFADETGMDDGQGANRNFPLPEDTDDKTYLATLRRALRRIKRHRPAWLVVSLGLDTLAGDPTGFFALTPDGLESVGRALAKLRIPTLIVQEGGYNLRNLRRGVQAFFTGWTDPYNT